MYFLHVDYPNKQNILVWQDGDTCSPFRHCLAGTPVPPSAHCDPGPLFPWTTVSMALPSSGQGRRRQAAADKAATDKVAADKAAADKAAADKAAGDRAATDKAAADKAAADKAAAVKAAADKAAAAKAAAAKAAVDKAATDEAAADNAAANNAAADKAVADKAAADKAVADKAAADKEPEKPAGSQQKGLCLLSSGQWMVPRRTFSLSPWSIKPCIWQPPNVFTDSYQSPDLALVPSRRLA